MTSTATTASVTTSAVCPTWCTSNSEEHSRHSLASGEAYHTQDVTDPESDDAVWVDEAFVLNGLPVTTTPSIHIELPHEPFTPERAREIATALEAAARLVDSIVGEVKA